MRDISERKRAEEALRASEERLRIIAETSPGAVFITGVSDGVIFYCNSAAREVLGSTEEDLRGRQVMDFYHDPNDRRSILELTRQQGTVRNLEGKPVAGAYVTAAGSGLWSRTDDIGRYTLPLFDANPTLFVHCGDVAGRSEPLALERTHGGSHGD